jgi:hypothetical protein
MVLYLFISILFLFFFFMLFFVGVLEDGGDGYQLLKFRLGYVFCCKKVMCLRCCCRDAI